MTEGGQSAAAAPWTEAAPRAALAAVLWMGTWLTFRAFGARLVEARPAPDGSLITPWLRGWVAQSDGLEMPVATAVLATLCAGLALLAHRRLGGRLHPAWSVAVLLGVLGSALRFRLLRAEFEPSATGEVELRWGLFGLATFLGGWALGRAGLLAGRRAALLLGLVLVLAVLVTASLTLPYLDYLYLIGPGTRLLAGERLGSFAMQYDLLSTLAAALLYRASPSLGFVALGFCLFFAAWFGVYAALALRVMRAPWVALAFVLSLVALRFFAVHQHPLSWPQVGPTRLDLWVVVALVAARRGVASWHTLATSCLFYVANDFFGLLTLGLVTALQLLALLTGQLTLTPRQHLARWALPAAVLLAHWATFQTFSSPAALLYADLRPGFMPISPDSLFWAILPVVLGLVALAPVGTDPAQRLFSLLVAGLAAVHLVYFFGRSHESNLINVSGAWLFALFLLVDRLTGVLAGRARALGVVACAGLVSTCWYWAGPRTSGKLDTLAWELRSGLAAFQPHVDESAVDGLYTSPPVLRDHALFLGQLGTLAHLRLRVPERGRFTPSEAWPFIDDYAAWLDQALLGGAHAYAADRDLEHLRGLDESAYFKQRSYKVRLTRVGQLSELSIDRPLEAHQAP